MRYLKSPVSEVVFGITFTSKVFELPKIFLAYKKLSETYPNLEILPPIADEAMVDFRLTTEVDFEKTGEFLLRLRTEDRKWLLQLQGNKIYLNWIRLDVEEVGHYVGFKAILNKLNEIIKIMSSVSGKDLSTGLRYLDLTYHDRIEWQPLISSISDSAKIMRFSPPDIGIPSGFNNIVSKYTYHEPRIGGYGILSINTATSAKNAQLLKFENTLRGLRNDESRDDWYYNAHNIQFEQFEKIFADSILKEWK